MRAPDSEGLLVSWLNELVAIVDSEGLVFRRFAIAHLSERDLVAHSYGETLDPARHTPHITVKAATYHNILVDPGPPARAHVLVDI